MSYDVSIFGGGRARVICRDLSGKKLAEAEGKIEDQPRALLPIASSGPLPYPLYEVVTIKGITEVIEHRARGDDFYIVDDEALKRRIGVVR